MPDTSSAPRDGDAKTPPVAVPMPNHFSCIDCRRRKVKCNKTHPCTNCTKANLTCVFPPPRRHGKGDSDPDPALIAKIHRLEKAVNSLRSTIVEKDALLAEHRRERQWFEQERERLTQEERRRSDEEQDHQHPEGQNDDKKKSTSPTRQNPSPRGSDMSEIIVAPAEPESMRLDFEDGTYTSPSSQWTPDWKAGKLIRDDGRRVYISGTFWAALTPQSDDFSDFGDDDTNGDDYNTSQTSTADTPLSDFPFQSSLCEKDWEHPNVENRQRMWTLFKENIDPVVKILHMPTIEPIVNEWLPRQDMAGIPRNLNALLFAIYFSAVSSLEGDVCRELLGSERDELVMKYRASEERALTLAGLSMTDDLLVMQSFIIYLTALRHHLPRLSWTWCSLAFRLLQSLGAHRDGASLSLSIYEAEMYKRLSWHLCLLECGAAEDSGCDPTIFEISSFNATLPLNIDDGDLSVTMDIELQEKPGWSESTLLILWAEICQLWRLLYDSRRRPEGVNKAFGDMSMDEKKVFLNNCILKFEKRYTKICSPLVPIQWVTATLARMLILEFKITASKPLERHAELSEAERDEFVADALEAIELFIKVFKDQRSVRWIWLFKMFTLWHPIAYVLFDLGCRPLQKEHKRAWKVVEQAMVSRWHTSHDKVGHQWRSLLHLLEIAQAAKSREIQRRRGSIRSRSDTLATSNQSVLQDPSLAAFQGSWEPSIRGHTPFLSSQGTAQISQTNSLSFDNVADFCNLFPINLPAVNLPDDDLDNMEIFGEFNFQDTGIDEADPKTSSSDPAFQSQETFNMDIS